jgi:hypothetical protein
MPLEATDIVYRLSIPTASTGYSNPQTNKDLSLGGWMSTTQFTNGSIRALFDNISSSEDAASDVEYRCFFIHNQSTVFTLYDAVVWVFSQVASGATVAIGVDPAGVSAESTHTQQAAVSANESTAPTGVTFSTPITEGTALTIGDIPPRSCAAVWVRRTATNSGEQGGDGCVITIKGDFISDPDA